MSESVRVRLENGVEKTFPADHPAVGAEGVTVLKGAPAVDQHGVPLPDTLPGDEPAGPRSYKGWLKPALLALQAKYPIIAEVTTPAPSRSWSPCSRPTTRPPPTPRQRHRPQSTTTPTPVPAPARTTPEEAEQ